MATKTKSSKRLSAFNDGRLIAILPPSQRGKIIASGREEITIKAAIKIVKDMPRGVQRLLRMRAEAEQFVQCFECGEGLLVFERHSAHCDTCDRRLFQPATPLDVLRRVFPERRQDS